MFIRVNPRPPFLLSTLNELTAVDAYQKNLLRLMPISAPDPIRTLAIDPATGHLYGTSANALFRIDENSAVATLVGPTSIQVTGALAFDRHGDLFGTGGRSFVKIDKTTGATSLVATLSATMLNFAVRPEDGVMYGLGFDLTYNLYTIDVGTGQLTLVGPSLVRPSGTAFATVPEPSGIVLCMTSVLVMTSMRRGYR